MGFATITRAFGGCGRKAKILLIVCMYICVFLLLIIFLLRGLLALIVGNSLVKLVANELNRARGANSILPNAKVVSRAVEDALVVGVAHLSLAHRLVPAKIGHLSAAILVEAAPGYCAL